MTNIEFFLEYKKENKVNEDQIQNGILNHDNEIFYCGDISCQNCSINEYCRKVFDHGLPFVSFQEALDLKSMFPEYFI